MTALVKQGRSQGRSQIEPEHCDCAHCAHCAYIDCAGAVSLARRACLFFFTTPTAPHCASTGQGRSHSTRGGTW
jgi:hypothetical protein